MLGTNHEIQHKRLSYWKAKMQTQIAHHIFQSLKKEYGMFTGDGNLKSPTGRHDLFDR